MIVEDEPRKKYRKYTEDTNMKDLEKYCDFLLEQIENIQCYPPQGLNPKIVHMWLSGYNACMIEVNNLIHAIKNNEKRASMDGE